MTTMEETVSLTVLALRLRALVLALGESAWPAWWKTEFMNETGLRFLERLYPRTSFHAAVHAAGRAACEVHDRAVGRIGVYHLFRLPESLEIEIYRVPPNSDEEFFVRFRSCLGRPDKLLEVLATFSSSGEATGAASGARRMGTEKDLMTSDAFGKMAAVYHHAFTEGKPAFPYFAADQRETRG